VVFAKRTFSGRQAVLAYLARYTHRVAISNARLIALGEAGVTNGRTTAGFVNVKVVVCAGAICPPANGDLRREFAPLRQRGRAPLLVDLPRARWRSFGGAVHAYVGDEVIVTWPVTDDPALNARCVECFFAIRRTISSLAPDYEAEFGIVPAFRAGMHAGLVVVSECGDAKRQLAYFGDTMNVAAGLCDYCKAIDQRLVISGDLLKLMTIPYDLLVGDSKSIAVRGRQQRVEAIAVEARSTPSP